MSRLLANGPLLPEIFRDVLAALYAEPRPAEELRKIIRSRVEFKEALILEHWESWESFCDDILAALADGGYLRQEDGLLSATARAVPGKQLQVLRNPQDLTRRVRFTFHARSEEQAREALAQSRIRAGEFASYLSACQDRHPALRQAREDAVKIMRLLSWALQDPDTPVRGSGSSLQAYIGGQSEWYREWVRTAGWHSTDVARLAWNAAHPGKEIAAATNAGFRTALRQLAEQGKLEKRPAMRKDGKTGGTEYRWTGLT